MAEPTPFVYPGAAPTARSYWVVAGRLLAGACPGHPDPDAHHARIAALYNAGARTFINLQEPDEKDHAGDPFRRYDDTLRELAARDGDTIAHLRFAIPDAGVTTEDRMRSILDAIDLSLTARRPVYVHCFGGMGRTATAVGCWLLRHGHAKPEDVLDVITRLRQMDPERAEWPAPENESQRVFVRRWLG